MSCQALEHLPIRITVVRNSRLGPSPPNNNLHTHTRAFAIEDSEPSDPVVIIITRANARIIDSSSTVVSSGYIGPVTHTG